MRRVLPAARPTCWPPLLHEAGNALAHCRGVKDPPRQGWCSAYCCPGFHPRRVRPSRYSPREYRHVSRTPFKWSPARGG
jgi:hypothetical protein